VTLTLVSEKAREPAECVIEVGADGREITDLYPFLTEITVEVSRTEAATATLTFETRRDEHGAWTVQDQEVLLPWEPIVIKAAFGTRTEEVMRGYIRQVQTEMPEDAGAARVKVECQDDSIRLDRTHRRKAWGADAPTSDTVILSTILSDYDGLSTHPDSASGEDQLQVNQDDTDIQFLKKRAEANGYELYFAEGQVYFGPYRLEASPQDTILVYAGAGTNCLSFNASADGHQADAVAFDLPAEEGSESTEATVEPDLPVMGQTHADSTSSGLEPFVWKMSGEAGAGEERLRALALQKANDFDLHKVTAEGELDGTLYGHVLQVGRPVGVDGVGSWLGGTYYVDKVTHQFTFQGYRQRFTLLRNAYGDNLDAAAGAFSGVLGALQDLF
jgi:phage protein D